MIRNRLQNFTNRFTVGMKTDLVLGVMLILTRVSNCVQSLVDQPDELQPLLSQFTVQERASADIDRSNDRRQASTDGEIDIR